MKLNSLDIMSLEQIIWTFDKYMQQTTHGAGCQTWRGKTRTKIYHYHQERQKHVLLTNVVGNVSGAEKYGEPIAVMPGT